MEGFREKVLKSRPSQVRPPKSFYHRYRVEESRQNGYPVFTISSKNGEAAKQLLYLHGGAYIYEIMNLQWKYLSHFLDEDNVVVTVPIYPLAPGKTCVEIFRFIEAVYVSLSSTKKPIIIVGDSSGGGMALSLAQQLRDAHLTMPESLVLISPWLDVTCSGPEQETLSKEDPLLALPGLRQAGAWYAGDLPPTDPRISPLFGGMQDLPPTFVLTGTHDLLNSDSHRLQTKMPSTELRVSEYRNMLHVWPTMPIPEAKMATNEIIKFIKSAVIH